MGSEQQKAQNSVIEDKPHSVIDAKVIKDSISPEGMRLTTVELKFHRFELPSLNTHRVFSRNSGSSRAIPVKREIERMRTDGIAFPLEFGTNQPGMQPGPPLEGDELREAREVWRLAAENAIAFAERLAEMNVHKQVVNRLLEPFLWHTVIITSTNWENFYAQRCHKDAQTEIRVPAEKIRDAIDSSFPETVQHGEWHLPYLRDEEKLELPLHEQRMVSVARCARVSYLTHDGVRDIEKDLELYEKLMAQYPPHYSPLEHVATPAMFEISMGNFTGWWQLRHLMQLNKVPVL